MLGLDRADGIGHVRPDDRVFSLDDDTKLGLHPPGAALRDVGGDDDWHDATVGDACRISLHFRGPEERGKRTRCGPCVCLCGGIPGCMDNIQFDCDGFAVGTDKGVATLTDDGIAQPLVGWRACAHCGYVPVHPVETKVPGMLPIPG